MAKVLEFQFQHQSFQWRLRSLSFRSHRVDLLAVQGTLKSLLQHHNSKPSILPCSALFMDQLSHPYTTDGKTIALTIGPLSAKWYLCFLTSHVSRFVIAFLQRSTSKCVLIFWLQWPSVAILEPKKIKSVTASTFPPSICHEVLGLDAVSLVFLNVEF